jgi:anti-sigma factor (TIGR02949 family)
VVSDDDMAARAAGRSTGDAADVDCVEAIHTLYHFLDGELTEYRRVEIQQHLEGCLPCLEAFDFEAELRVVVSTCCRRDEVPEDLRARVVQALRALGEQPTS